MIYYPFDLSDYFKQTRKYYYFFDGLFTLENKLKRDILDDLNIPDSTYRTNRLKETAKNQNHFIILHYFKYNELQGKQEIYERCLSQLFNAIYYRKIDSLQFLSQELEKFIEEKNYLKPVFILFRILIGITQNLNYYKMLEIVSEDLDYLALFPKLYFTPELYFLSSLILYYCGRKKCDPLLKNYSIQFPQLSWLYHTLRGSFEYLHEHDYEAMIYFELSLKNFQMDLNVTRIITETNNIAYLHNIHGQYEISLEYSKLALPHTFYQETNSKFMSYLSMHYLFSNFMLERYFEIKQFFSIYNLDGSNISPISAVIGIAAAKTMGIPIREFHPVLEDMKGKYSELIYFENALNKPEENANLKSLTLYSNLYFKKIVEKMKFDI